MDGVTGEKGLANYSAFRSRAWRCFSAEWDRAIPGFLDEATAASLGCMTCTASTSTRGASRATIPYRATRAGLPARSISIKAFDSSVRAESAYSHQDALLAVHVHLLVASLPAHRRPAFVQALYIANDERVDGLPYDLFADDPEASGAASPR